MAGPLVESGRRYPARWRNRSVMRYTIQEEIDLRGEVLILWALGACFAVFVLEAGFLVFRGYLWLRYGFWPLISVHDVLQPSFIISHPLYNRLYSWFRATLYPTDDWVGCEQRWMLFLPMISVLVC